MTLSANDEEIQILDRAEDYLIQTANMGRDLAAFQNSTAGRMLMGRCMETVSASINTLLDTDPSVSPDVCARAYKDAKMARDTLHWIWDAVAEGKSAEDAIISEMPEITLEEVLKDEQV